MSMIYLGGNVCHERGHFHLVALPAPMISSDDRGDRRDATLLRTSSRHAYYMRSSDTVRCALTEGRQGMRGSRTRRTSSWGRNHSPKHYVCRYIKRYVSAFVSHSRRVHDSRSGSAGRAHTSRGHAIVDLEKGELGLRKHGGGGVRVHTP